MFKLKTIVVAAILVGAFATLAAGSMLTGVGMNQRGVATASEIDVFELMTKAGDLPVETVDNPV